MSLSLTFVSASTYRWLCRWVALALLLPLLIAVLPPLMREYAPPSFALPGHAPSMAVPTAPGDTSLPIAPSPQIPAGLGPVLNATLAADSTEDYAAVALAASPDTLRADNTAQRFTTTFDADGVQIAPASGAGFSMRATAILAAGGTLPLAAVPPASDGPRVEYRRDGITEWYINGPRGLEQGFTFAAPPAGAEQFRVALAITGTAPTQAADGTLLLGDLRYGDLTVTDAAGARLAAHLDVADGAIQIAVDARGAQWPVTIDPTVTAATLTASDGVGGDALGQSVAVATSLHTTTVVVGAPNKNGVTGAVYVFTGSGGTYNQRAKLTASDGASYDFFGYSVAVTSTGGIATIVVGAYRHANPGVSPPGQVYVFVGSGTAYPQQAILSAADGTNFDSFGYSVAAITDGTTETIVVGAQNGNRNRAYVFTGNGTTYTQRTEFQGTGAGYYSDGFGASVAIASVGGVNTIVVGASVENVPGTAYAGDIWVFTGSGASYSSVRLQASDAAALDLFGVSVAVATAHGQSTIVVGADSKISSGSNRGVVYVFVGSGASYAQTAELIDNPGSNSAYFGASVAVGFAGGSTVIAVGANDRNPQVAVALFTGGGASYTESDLPESPAGSGYDNYGTSVALMTAVNGDVAVVGGAPGANSSFGGATLSYYQTTPAVNSIQATIGDGAQVSASPAGTFNGDALDIVATAFDALGNPSIPVPVTLTVNYAGAARGIFNPGDPTSTTLHTTTASDTDARSDGATPFLSVFPSDTAGTFTVTAAVDGTQLSATFHLTIIQGIPSPTIGGTASSHLTSTGISPPVIPTNLPTDAYIAIYGDGFLARYSHVWMSFDAVSAHDVQVADSAVVYFNGTTLGAYLDHTRIAAGTFTNMYGQFINIYVTNSPGPSGSGGGRSSNAPLYIVAPAPAPAGSHVDPVGATTLHLAPVTPAQLATAANDSGGSSLAAKSATTANLVSAGGGNLVSAGGGNLVSAGGGNIVGACGGCLVSAGGGNLKSSLNAPAGSSAIGKGGGAQPNAAPPANDPQLSGVAKRSQGGGAPSRNTLSNLPVRNPYYTASDANGVIFSPAITSNGVPGTYTRTVAVDGIAAPVTYTIINLDPNDGHPAAITHLSSGGAAAGGPGFTLTAAGTGFVAGSVLSYGGVQLTTTVDSATQVHAAVPAILLKYSGALDVLVINPDPNGGASLPVTFTVTPAIAVSALSPTLVTPGSAQFTLTVTGANFQSGWTVKFNGTALATTFVSATTLTATVPASLVAVAGTPPVTVVDPVGGTSNAVAFTVSVVNALPPVQPTASPLTGTSPLPGSRQPAGPLTGGSPPNPLPSGR